MHTEYIRYFISLPPVRGFRAAVVFEYSDPNSCEIKVAIVDPDLLLPPGQLQVGHA